MFCPSCGAKNPSGATTCIDCSRALPSSNSGPQRAAPGPRPAPAPATAPAQAQPPPVPPPSEPPRILRRQAPLAPPALDAVPRKAVPPAAPGGEAATASASPGHGDGIPKTTASATALTTTEPDLEPPRHARVAPAPVLSSDGLPPTVPLLSAVMLPTAGDGAPPATSATTSAMTTSAATTTMPPPAPTTAPTMATERERAARSSPHAHGSSGNDDGVRDEARAAARAAAQRQAPEATLTSTATATATATAKAKARGAPTAARDERMAPASRRAVAPPAPTLALTVVSTTQQWLAAVIDAVVGAALVAGALRVTLLALDIKPSAQALVDVLHSAPTRLLPVALALVVGVLAAQLLPLLLPPPRGASVGQRLLRLRVVRADGSAPTRTRLVVRGLVNGVGVLLFLAGPAWALFVDPLRRGPGDVVAGTVAVRR